MRLLLFGSRGQVGWELSRSLAPLGEVIRLTRDSRDHCGDLTDPAGIGRSIEQLAPDIVVNAAAYTTVERAESEAALAQRVNAETPGRMAAAAHSVGALIVHYSTDYVFDGRLDRAYREADSTNPLNAYGRSKLDGEMAIADATASHLIFRTSWVYAPLGRNFLKTVLRLCREEPQLTLPSDQIGAPTAAELIADVTAHAIRATLQDPALAGLYHLSAAGATSWYDYARFIAERAAAPVPGQQHAVKIQPILTAERPGKAERPLNSRLDTERLRSAFGLSLPPWETGVERALAELSMGGAG